MKAFLFAIPFAFSLLVGCDSGGVNGDDLSRFQDHIDIASGESGGGIQEGIVVWRDPIPLGDSDFLARVASVSHPETDEILSYRLSVVYPLKAPETGELILYGRIVSAVVLSSTPSAEEIEETMLFDPAAGLVKFTLGEMVFRYELPPSTE